MLNTIDEYGFLERILALDRPGEENIFAFYDHRLRAVMTNPRLMLVPLDDHLVHRGDGAFETLKYVDGKIYQLDAHLDRMGRSLHGIKLTPPCPWPEIRDIVIGVAQTGGRKRGILTIFIGRGPGGFTPDPRECAFPSLYVVARRFPQRPESFWENGVTACRSGIPVKPGHQVGLKTVNYLNNVLMKMEAAEKGCDYTLGFTPDNHLAEGAAENVVIVGQDGQVVIPDTTHVLVGTTLARTLELLALSGISTITRSIRESEIYDAREVILLGTSIDAVSVVRYNGRAIHDVRPGPMSRKLRAMLQDDLQKTGTPFL
ncbi:MAG: aminodeoxychorismate lyase [Deltaproteobacteria bacterium]|nr:aminodeoxychorismate lyase [Deltaproteobacteria bacterium]